MFSALENMLTANYCERSLWEAAEQEMFSLMENDEAVFYYSFIQGIAVRMGIPQTSFSRIAAMPELAPTTVPVDEELKLKQFCELVILSQVDFQKSDDEKKLLYEMGAHMNIPSQKIDNLERFLSLNKLPNDVSELMATL